MSERRDEGGATRGLSLVDATVADTAREEAAHKPEDDAKVAAAADHDAREDLTEDSFVEEAEEKINLFDVIQEKESEKENKDNFQNSTLIITTEEHLEATVCDDAAKEANSSVNADVALEDQKKASTKTKGKNEDHSYIWVSNIGHHVKATDLKKLFSEMGRVVTAKVLTNGRNYFGYISVDSSETAGRCIKQLNNALFDGKRITVSKDRPDLRETKQLVKLETRKKRLEGKSEFKMIEEQQEMKRKTSEEEEAKNNAIADLKKRTDRFKTEISKYKWKILEYQRRHEGMRKKCGALEKELKELQYKTRGDRRRLNQDRELFEKTKKMDMLRMETDKAALGKELCEVRKLREHLKEKIDEIKAQSAKKNQKRRDTRSPPVAMERSRSPRGRSPLVRVSSRIGYRSEDRSEKRRKRDEPLRGRTPPPPPKLSNGTGKKRGEGVSSHRQYFDEIEKRPSSLEHHGYEYRQKPAFAQPQEASRPPWQAPYSKDPRRVPAAPSGGHQGYPPDPRYGGGYQFPPSSIAVPSRSYYPEFGKPYGHY